MNTLELLPQDVLLLILDYSRNPASLSSVNRRLRGIAIEWLKGYNKSLILLLPNLKEFIKPDQSPKRQFMVLYNNMIIWSIFYRIKQERIESRKQLFDNKCAYAFFGTAKLAVFLHSPHRYNANDLHAAREIAKKNSLSLKERTDGNRAWNELITHAPRIGRFLNKGDQIEDRLMRIPSQIGQLNGLNQIDLSNNRISTIPPEIGQLHMLQFLNLSSNWIESVPKEIGNLTRLTILNLNDNRCKFLPPQLTQLVNLRQFFVTNNQLTFLPDLTLLPHLEELKASGNHFKTAKVNHNVETDLGSCIIS